MKYLHATLALFGAVAAAVAVPGSNKHSQRDNCVSHTYIEDVVAKQIIFLQHLPGTEEESRTAAVEIFDSNVQEYGDSINSLRGDAVGFHIYDAFTKSLS